MYKLITHLTKDISSSLARSYIANRNGDKADELKYLLYAVHDISILLLNRFDDLIDEDTAKEYAIQLVNTSKRIREIMEG